MPLKLFAVSGEADLSRYKYFTISAISFNIETTRRKMLHLSIESHTAVWKRSFYDHRRSRFGINILTRSRHLSWRWIEMLYKEAMSGLGTVTRISSSMKFFMPRNSEYRRKSYVQRDANVYPTTAWVMIAASLVTMSPIPGVLCHQRTKCELHVPLLRHAWLMGAWICRFSVVMVWAMQGRLNKKKKKIEHLSLSLSLSLADKYVDHVVCEDLSWTVWCA